MDSNHRPRRPKCISYRLLREFHDRTRKIRALPSELLPPCLRSEEESNFRLRRDRLNFIIAAMLPYAEAVITLFYH